MWSTISLSFRPNHFIGSNLEGIFLPPWKWSNAAYKALLGNRGFIMAFTNSFKILIMGVATALVLNIPLAYGLSVKTLPGRKIFNIFVIIPYVFSVGLIPTYLVVTGVGLTNHLAAVFLPVAISTYNLLIMKQFFEGIPEKLKESARIDGASEFYVLLRIVLPLSKPILMTLGLYYGVAYWNDFFHAMIYLNKSSLQPLPILLRNILMASGMNEFVEVNAFGEASIQSIKAASVFMAAIPMIIAYPFIQKFFTKGTLLGSIKG
ncbi:MAG: carbohydrate ABC transporter permease [Spirochaetota bacterium]